MEEMKTMVKLAHYYYRDGLTQEQIAEKMSMSRQKINRMLKRLLKEGIVKIEIMDYMASNIELERKLEKHFGLKNAVVVTEPDDEKLLERLGSAAAGFIKPYLQPGMRIGVGWGRTIRHVAENICERNKEKHKDLAIVQIAGRASNNSNEGMSREIINQSDEIVMMFSQHLGATPYFFHAPAFVESNETKKALLEDPSIKSSLSLISKCDMALMGIGGVGAGISPFREGLLGRVHLDELLSRGAVGHVAFSYFDIQGRRIHTSLDEKLVAPAMEQLRCIPLIVGIGGGKEKQQAILGALRGKLLDVVVTNHETADYLLNSK